MTTEELEKAKKLEMNLHIIELYLDKFSTTDLNEMLFHDHGAIYISNEERLYITERLRAHLEKRKGDLEKDLAAL